MSATYIVIVPRDDSTFHVPADTSPAGQRVKLDELDVARIPSRWKTRCGKSGGVFRLVPLFDARDVCEACCR